MSESKLTNHDGIPQYTRTNLSSDTHLYHTQMIRTTTGVDTTSKPMTIFVQNPFEDPSANVKYIHDSSSPRPHNDDISISTNSPVTTHSRPMIQQQNQAVRYNPDLLNNFSMDIPITRQTGTTEIPSSPSNSTSTTSLIPLPAQLSNNLGVNIHHMNQPSITSTMIGTYSNHPSSSQTNYIPSQNNFDHHYHHQHHQMSGGMYVNNPHQIVGKMAQATPVRPSNGTPPIIVHYPTMMQTQQYPSQMMKTRMMPPNTYPTPSQVIMSQQASIIYDSNSVYRTNGQQTHHLSPDDNILKTLLQINPQTNSETGLKSHPTPNGTDHKPMNTLNTNAQIKVPKQRKKRKANDLNASNEEDAPPKSRKRKKKGAEETEKFVENSLQQLRDLPMLIPAEPTIDINDDQSLSIPLNISKTSINNYQGKFGDIFIENIPDYYRPNRRIPTKVLLKNSNSSLERHYRLCSNIIDQNPSLPTGPLLMNSSEKIIEYLENKTNLNSNAADADADDQSIISTSTLAGDDDDYQHLVTDNINLLGTLSSYDKESKCLSPIFDEKLTSEIVQTSNNPIVDGIDKISVTLTLTTEAANNVQSVIAAVADLLKIACPTTFDVHQNQNNCQCSNDILSNDSCSHKTTFNHRNTSVYKIGRQTNTSIQTLIDAQPKLCRSCSQNLTSDNLLKKRLNELPSNLRELTPNSEPFIYFCNELCYTTYVNNVHPPQTVLNQLKSEPIDVQLSICKRQQIDETNIIKPWKRWDSNLIVKMTNRLSNKNDIDRLIENIKLPLGKHVEQDKRICVFCHNVGDMISNGPGRLLNLDVGQWCHTNCALWSSEVYETVSGALMSVEQAFTRSINLECVICKQKGASSGCFYQRCPNVYHFTCAIDNGCVFYKNKTIMCPTHASKAIGNDQILEDKSVHRKVWINRDEIKQIQNYLNEERDDKSYLLRIGSLILHNIGQLLPHQLQSSVFHNRNFIYPVGYTVTRFYWSMRYPNRRCAYLCSIVDVDNKPMFRVRVQENDNEQVQEFLESTAKDVWHKIINEIDSLRRKNNLVKMFSVFVNGEDLYGLTEPHIIRLIESLPGVEILQNYAFKYGRLQLFDMPLTVNPTGCARSEPKLRTHFRRHAQTLTSSHSSRNVLARTVPGNENTQISYVKQFVLSKSTQYRKLKSEWRQNVYLAKSRIQGLGLFAARDLEKHTMVIEYIGEIIRNEVANHREKLYEQQNRGIYMFRLTDDFVVDATMSGCLARYINHSCEPNSIAEVVQIEKDYKIIIITNRRIAKGEELMYDYKFDFEEDSKIPCLCGAVNCRKWMN